MPVVDVGIGVGYFWYAASRSEGEERACLFEGRGKPGDEENGSNAGSSDGAGRFTPEIGGKLGWEFILLGEESIMAEGCQKSTVKATTFRRGYQDRAGTRLTPPLISRQLSRREKTLKHEIQVKLTRSRKSEVQADF